MGDVIYYETAGGKVAKRDYKSPADLRAAIATETDPENVEEMQARLDRRLQHVSKGGRATVRGMNWLQKRLNSLASLVDSAVEAAVGVEEGELGRQRERLMRERQLIEATLQTQGQLKERFAAQEAAEKAKAAQLARLAAAARKEKIAAVRTKRKRKGTKS